MVVLVASYYLYHVFNSEDIVEQKQADGGQVDVVINAGNKKINIVLQSIKQILLYSAIRT